MSLLLGFPLSGGVGGALGRHLKFLEFDDDRVLVVVIVSAALVRTALPGRGQRHPAPPPPSPPSAGSWSLSCLVGDGASFTADSAVVVAGGVGLVGGRDEALGAGHCGRGHAMSCWNIKID